MPTGRWEPLGVLWEPLEVRKALKLIVFGKMQKQQKTIKSEKAENLLKQSAEVAGDLRGTSGDLRKSEKAFKTNCFGEIQKQ